MALLLSYFILLKINLDFSKTSIIIGNIFGLIIVYSCSYLGIAWTLLILICFIVNLIFTLIG